MIYKIKQLFILITFFLFSSGLSIADEKFEGLIVSVDSEAITTYDLSERIKLVLKSIKLEDNIKNRDSVRDRVLELLILEKIKKLESKKFNIEISEDELKTFISQIYDFPVNEFDKFKIFLKQENIDIDVVKEQLEAELLWQKFTRQKFSSKIIINKNEVERLANNLKNKVGKIEYNYSEIFFKNLTDNDWVNTKKRMEKVLLLLDSNSSFDLIAKKFDENISASNLSKNRWVLEDNLDDNQQKLVKSLKVGEIKSNIKTKNGYKILKLNKKRPFGNQALTYSFIKFSSFNKNLSEIDKRKIDCDLNESEFKIDEISFLKLSEMKANEISEVFLEEIKKTNIGSFTDVVEVSGENNMLLICNKSDPKNNIVNKERIETKLFSEKFNQLSNTYLANLRKNINVKFFTK